MATKPKNEGVEMSRVSSRGRLLTPDRLLSDDVVEKEGSVNRGSERSDEGEETDTNSATLNARTGGREIQEVEGDSGSSSTQNARTGGDRGLPLVVGGNTGNPPAQNSPTTPKAASQNNAANANTVTGGGGNCCGFCCKILFADLKSSLTLAKKWFCELQDDVKWVEEMRGYVATVAGLVTTMAFAAALAPPGGVVSVALGDSIEKAQRSVSVAQMVTKTNADSPMPAGEAISAITYPGAFSRFLYWNTNCMYLSLLIFIIMMSGLPLKHPIVVWFSSMLVLFDVYATANVFTIMLSMITPLGMGVWKSDAKTRRIVLNIWMGVLIAVAAVMTARLVYWYVKKLAARVKEAKRRARRVVV